MNAFIAVKFSKQINNLSKVTSFLKSANVISQRAQQKVKS